MKLGFTFFGNENHPCPLCLVCGGKLANKGMVSNNLKRHFSSKHGNLSEKPVEYLILFSIQNLQKSSRQLSQRE